jgi:small ligand-binding sensory domain FIST
MSTVHAAAALSEHPVPAVAVGEVAGQLLDALGPEPDLVCVFATAPHTGAMEDIAAALQSLLQPGAMIGCTAGAVVGDGRGIEDTPALSVWAARLATTPLTLSLGVEQTPDGYAIRGLPDDAAARAATLLLLPDPFSFPVDAFLEGMRQSFPDLRITGGLASAARGPGGNRLVVDGRVVSSGAVGVLLDSPSAPAYVVSQGCRPVGQPWTVTASEGNLLRQLGGRPALERLMETLQGLDPDDRELATRGLHCGIVADESKLDPGRGDFLVRGVMGVDREQGIVAVGDQVPVGTIVQFHVRDPGTAGDDLRHLLADAGGHPAGALLFTCNGRGSHLFGSADHDAAIVQEVFAEAADLPVAGFFCAGELGPVARRNALHGFTASVALFGPGAPAGREAAP